MKLRVPSLPLVMRAAALATPIVCAATSAHAQRPPRAPATEAFSLCRAQEALGDARPCWSVWTEKYKKSGTEAEVAYAETHAQSSELPARLQLVSTPSAEVSLDGRSLGRTPRDGIAVPPGEHRVAFVHEGRSEGRTVTLVAGEDRKVSVDFNAPPPTPIPVKLPDPIPRPPAPAGDVLDFCALSPDAGSRKERVVLLAPSRIAALNDDARLRAVDAANLVREILPARFAMERFYNVLGSLPGKRGWEKRDELSLAEVRAFLAQPPVDLVTTSADRLERERPFISYSLGCADYLVVATILSHATSWGARGATQTKDEAESSALAPSFRMDGVLAVFRREGDSFRRIAALSGTAPPLRELEGAPAPAHKDLPAHAEHVDAAALAHEPKRMMPDLPSYVSAVPDPACLRGKVATSGVAGLTACTDRGEGTLEQALGDLDERVSAACERAHAEATTEEERGPLAVQCTVRTRAYELARSFAEDARSIDRWNLFGVLARSKPATFALGRAEGVKIGDAFEVVDENNDRIAFFKAERVGPGGIEGGKEPTLLSSRLGEASPGARVDVHPQLGLVLTMYGGYAILPGGSGTITVHSGNASQPFSLPGSLLGVSGAVGLDISSLVSVPETYVRAGAGILTGNGLNTSALLVPIDVWIEKGFYLGRRLTFTSAVGATIQRNSMALQTAVGSFVDTFHVSSTTYGPTARLGLDILLHPEWSVKVEAVARLPLNDANYDESDGKVLPAEWQDRSDHFATLAASVGLAKTF